jgi:hypothetical protein
MKAFNAFEGEICDHTNIKEYSLYAGKNGKKNLRLAVDIN